MLNTTVVGMRDHNIPQKFSSCDNSSANYWANTTMKYNLLPILQRNKRKVRNNKESEGKVLS